MSHRNGKYFGFFLTHSQKAFESWKLGFVQLREEIWVFEGAPNFEEEKA
jgi:hypothetical protein